MDPRRPVELNCDVGELPDEPAALWALAHRVNIACGGHAGDADTMREACRRARVHGAKVGAHPSYPDREHFGRMPLALPLEALQATLEAQCGALRDAAREVGVEVTHLKPHGALYHAADREDALARAVVSAMVRALSTVALVGPPGGALARAAQDAGVVFLREGFADRAYGPDGTLVPRGTPGALLTDPPSVVAQVRCFVASGRYDTLCVHGDTPGAVALARAVRAALDGGPPPAEPDPQRG
jgi:UPF0271 protein